MAWDGAAIVGCGGVRVSRVEATICGCLGTCLLRLVNGAIVDVWKVPMGNLLLVK